MKNINGEDTFKLQGSSRDVLISIFQLHLYPIYLYLIKRADTDVY